MSGKFRVGGALFPKDAPNGPVFAGTIEIDGVKTAISVWEKTSAAGNQYLQISEDKRGQAKIDAAGGGGAGSKFAGKPNQFKRQTPVSKKIDPDDDDGDLIPF